MATTTMDETFPEGRYRAVQRWLHWSVAVLVLANLLGGLALAVWGFSGLNAMLGQAATNTVYTLHKSFGVLILGLMAARCATRYLYRHPPMPSTLTPRQSQIAYTTHVMFYVLLVAMPVLGWLGTDLGGYPVEFFGLDLSFLPKEPGAGEAFFVFHGIVGIAIAALAVLHIGAALDHRRRRDGVFQRISLP